MKLINIHVWKADTCGSLLDGFSVQLRSPLILEKSFAPFCLIGPNGAGKSQFLQIVAEMFQSVFHAVAPSEERVEGNSKLQFEIEYILQPHMDGDPVHVRISRKALAKGAPRVVIQLQDDAGEWRDQDLKLQSTLDLLPKKIVGYTSGDNETLSLPFLLSRGGYADEVARRAIDFPDDDSPISDTRLMLIDYGTHLEVLVANLLMSPGEIRHALLDHARLNELHSFRCVVQLAHSAAPKAPKHISSRKGRKGIQLTAELEEIVDRLRRCATCYDYDPNIEKYTFDFFVNSETEKGFCSFWDGAFELYSSLHKLAMLNDLAISRTTRNRFRRETEDQRFASRLPEPQDEDKVFRFTLVKFTSTSVVTSDVCNSSEVDYVSLSDGEHQLSQLLGTFCMVSFPDVLFLLDEPESHFNPQWRVRFISDLLDLPTVDGTRRSEAVSARQDALMTTHAPFVPSDIDRSKVLIFNKTGEKRRIGVRRPDIQTFGSTFDAILEECFAIEPPISCEPQQEIEKLKQSNDADEVRAGIERLGYSAEKVLLADHMRQLEKREG